MAIVEETGRRRPRARQPFLIAFARDGYGAHSRRPTLPALRA
jgi:hypothetical protein